jgi:hypothetical protein
MGSFVDYVESHTGQEYLAYKRVTDKYAPKFSANNSMTQKILQSNKDTFLNRFNHINDTSYSYQELIGLMDSWTTDGTIGAGIIEYLNNLADMTANGQAQAYGTSGSLKILDDSGNFVTNLSNARTVFNTSKKKAMASIVHINSAVEVYVNNIITLLEGNGREIMSAAIQNAYNKGIREAKGVSPDAPSNGEIDTSGNTKMMAAMKSIGNSIGELQALGKSGKNAKDFKKSYSHVIGSLNAAINSFGGLLHEAIFTYAALVAAEQGNKLIKDFNDTLEAEVGSYGVKWTSTGTVDDGTTGGQEEKSDVQFTYNHNGVALTFGGSIKLRQNSEFRKAGKSGLKLGVSGLIARNETYASLSAKLNAYDSNASQSGYRMVGAEGAIRKNFINQWYDLRNCLAALELVDALSGLGQSVSDFSALFIVNNRIFSIADILEKVYQNSANMLSSTKNELGKSFSTNGFDLDSIGTEVDKARKEKENEGMKAEAIARNQQAYKILAATKISITLNLGNLYGKIW